MHRLSGLSLSVSSHAARLRGGSIVQIPKASFAQKRWKHLGDLKAPNPATKWNSYGGNPVEAKVIRTSSAKTVVVEYFNYDRDPTYKVHIKRRIRLMVHDENSICHVGDTVLISQSRPYSKQKHHVIKEILHKDPGILYLSQHPELYVSPLQIRGARREEMDVRTLTKEEKMEREAKRLEKEKKQQEAKAQEKPKAKAQKS